MLRVCLWNAGHGQVCGGTVKVIVRSLNYRCSYYKSIDLQVKFYSHPSPESSIVDNSALHSFLFSTSILPLRPTSHPYSGVQADLGSTLRCAGGWVRDKLMGRQSLDIDIALDNMLGKDFAERVNEYLKAHVRCWHQPARCFKLCISCTALWFGVYLAHVAVNTSATMHIFFKSRADNHGNPRPLKWLWHTSGSKSISNAKLLNCAILLSRSLIASCAALGTFLSEENQHLVCAL